MTTTCRMCGQGALPIELDLGTAAYCVESPPSDSAARALPRHPFRLGSCPVCGVIQLHDLPSLDALKPPTQAILYRDPERHLDDLAQVTESLLQSKSALVMGMSYKDVSLLDRLSAKGYTNQKILDRTEDWRLTNPRDGIETMQARCTVEWADEIRRKHGRVDLLVVRHILEHAHVPPAFLAACRRLTEPNGLVLFEVPGCETEFARGDDGTLWEEHVSYFTAESLRRSLALHGFRSQVVGSYPYTTEDCLAIIAQVGTASPVVETTGEALLSEFDRARSQVRERITALATRERTAGCGIAVYGAGHRTATWIELAGLSEIVTCVIDDDPTKQGRYLAGSGIPIGPARWLKEKHIGVCIGLLSVDIVRKIAARETDFVSAGGRFLTIEDTLLERASYV